MRLFFIYKINLPKSIGRLCFILNYDFMLMPLLSSFAMRSLTIAITSSLTRVLSGCENTILIVIDLPLASW